MKATTRKGAWVAGITALFVGLYAGLRAIPVSQCEFLHYEPTETKAAAPGTGEEELCSVGPVPFVDVSLAPFPVRIEVLSLAPVGEEEVELLFSLIGPGGDPLLPHELAVTHTRKIHLMLIDPALESYHHLHPEPVGDSGDYRVRFVPRAEKYRYFAEFVPLRTRLLAVADGTLSLAPGEVAGEAAPAPVEMELEGTAEPLRPNRDHRLVLRVRNKTTGSRLPLEKTMDAYAHLVGFEDTLSGYAHMHPTTVDPEIGETVEMEFVFHPTRPGRFRIWAQVRANGRDIFRPFDVEVI